MTSFLNGPLDVLIGHIAAEHSRLLLRLIEKTDVTVTATLNSNKPRWSRRAGGTEIPVSVLVASEDEIMIVDLNRKFKLFGYVC